MQLEISDKALTMIKDKGGAAAIDFISPIG